MLEASSQGIYKDLVWDDLEALEATHFDVYAAGAYRLGRRAAALFKSRPREVVAELLRDDEFTHELARAMKGSSARRLIGAYASGFLGVQAT